MTQLREAMIDAMLLRGFSPRTHQSYLSAVVGLVRYYHRPPDQISEPEIQRYFLYLVKERQLSPASRRLILNGLVFLYRQVLERPFSIALTLPKRPQRIPELLTREEVAAILAACTHHKRRMLLTLCYGCGLRLNELVHLQVSDIDGERCLLRIDQGKGHKDRLVEMSATLLVQLRDYWRALRPLQWLFPGRDSGMPLCANTPQKYYTEAKRQAGVVKTGGIHALRHAYATHSLAAGMPITHLQHQLGHRDIRTTMRYLHWVPSYAGGAGNTDLIAALAHRHER